jgi:uncharacterized membrane protein YkoI
MTRVSLAKKGTKSLKTTVLEGIAEFLELTDKDEIEWKMQVHDHERLALIKKINTLKKASEIATEYADVKVVNKKK